MRVGYCVVPQPELASYRLRVAIPAQHLGCEYAIGTTGAVTFFYKQGNPALAKRLSGPVVYDVVNDHFRGPQAADYHAMCGIAAMVTVASHAMAETVRQHTGRDAVLIADPYENGESPARCDGNGVLWFGHSANIRSLFPHLDAIDETRCDFVVCSNVPKAVPWTRANEDACLEDAAIVLLTGGNRGASANRVIKALRAGRFVVVPEDCAESWREFAPYIHIGDIANGVNWAFHHREEACRKIQAGQHYIRQRFNPQLIGSRWTELFDSILGPDTKSLMVG